MKRTTVFESFDGKIFFDEENCKLYEDKEKEKVLLMLTHIIDICDKAKECKSCPFNEKNEAMCSIMKVTESTISPNLWKFN